MHRDQDYCGSNTWRPQRGLMLWFLLQPRVAATHHALSSMSWPLESAIPTRTMFSKRRVGSTARGAVWCASCFKFEGNRGTRISAPQKLDHDTAGDLSVDAHLLLAPATPTKIRETSARSPVCVWSASWTPCRTARDTNSATDTGCDTRNGELRTASCFDTIAIFGALACGSSGVSATRTSCWRSTGMISSASGGEVVSWACVPGGEGGACCVRDGCCCAAVLSFTRPAHWNVSDTLPSESHLTHHFPGGTWLRDDRNGAIFWGSGLCDSVLRRCLRLHCHRSATTGRRLLVNMFFLGFQCCFRALPFHFRQRGAVLLFLYGALITTLSEKATVLEQLTGVLCF